ncbi:hypothetical protein LB543_21490 [Mesorhizobium sp. ESP7-2]|uniref:hypothetical protein n=1 Tax=Mesorhizobium sp. ESP7-2 TaxID=2876622 RepID=UPI001CCE059B|nr:hypothetical protein [Mesorhizobium sp. ESP7-2]MBZ9709302.1 hypothetical protein [Mesorhizobium sp. ESP7-2]
MKETDYHKQLSHPSEPVREMALMFTNYIPIVGPTVTWLTDQVWPDPGRIARDHFLVALAMRVDELHDKQSAEAAMRQEHSAAILADSMSIASRSFGEKKLQALRNATASGIFHSPEKYNMSALVLSMIDRLTDGHITMLQEIARQGQYDWQYVTMIGVESKVDKMGMTDPTGTVIFEGSEQEFIDNDLLKTNGILRDDLLSLGLIARRETIFPGSSLGGPPSSHIEAIITPKAELLLREIEGTPPKPSIGEVEFPSGPPR